MSDKEEREKERAMVLAQIGAGTVRASAIEKATGLHMRSVDRALQSLRKAGHIEFVGGVGSGWRRTS